VTELNIRSVGDLYYPGRTELPERCDYNFYDAGHELVIMMGSPTAKEIEDVRKGDPKFQLYTAPETLVLLFKMGDQPWSDAFYSYWLVPQERRAAPQDLQPGQLASLMIYLVDAMTGKIVVMRNLTFPEKFGQRLHKSIQKQIEHPVSAKEIDAATRRLLQYDSKTLADMGMRQSSKA
jgi:hypothetical protein